MWPFTKPVSGKAQAAFDHAKIYREINEGSGVSSLSVAAGNLAGQFTERLRRVDELVSSAIRRGKGAWTGAAADGMTQQASPFRDVVEQSQELSATLARGVEQQGEHFSRAKNNMPAPHPVPPLDLGFSDLIPINLADKLAGQARHEAQHTAAEEKARQDYDTYRTSSNATIDAMRPYPPVPPSVADVGVANTHGPQQAINPETGHTAHSGTGSYSSTHNPLSSTDRTSRPIHGAAPVGNAGGNQPAQSGSSWADPGLPGTSPAAPPGTGSGTSSGPGPDIGVPGGGGISTGGPSLGTGNGRGGSLGAGGRTGGNTRGPGSSRTLGPGGGSSAKGPSEAGTTSSGTARAGSRAGLAGAGGPAQGRRSDEDHEHERKYVKDSDEHFEFTGEVDPVTGQVVAPPVIGERPPRPREERP